MVVFIALIIGLVLLGAGMGVTMAISWSLGSGLMFAIAMAVYLVNLGIAVLVSAIFKFRLLIFVTFFAFVGAVMPFVFGWV